VDPSHWLRTYLIDAVVIGKASLDEFAGWKNMGRRSENHSSNAWSAIGGQISAAYVEGGYANGGDPLGSSGGSAVGVSEGFAALGTDTSGSVVSPFARLERSRNMTFVSVGASSATSGSVRDTSDDGIDLKSRSSTPLVCT
jgi:hypothetical protein